MNEPSESTSRWTTAGHHEDRFRLLVESVRDYAIFILEPDGTIASWNPGAERFKGYKAHEIIGKHFSQFYTKEDKDAGKPARELKIAEAEGRLEDEGWRVRKDGSLFWANVIITALRDHSGKLVGFAKVTRDLSERRRAEEALRLSEERYRTLVASVKDYAIFKLDASGRVETWNDGARRLLGYETEDILGRHVSILHLKEDLGAGSAQRLLKTAAETGRAENEGWRIRKDGSRFWANAVITAIRSGSGELTGFSKVTRDLTERRAHEASLNAAMAELQKSNQELDEYAAFVSHDLQEPLRKVASFAELLARRLGDKVDQEGKEYIHYIVDGAKRMRSLIVDLLDYSRIGREEPPMEPVDLGKLLDGVLGDLELAVKDAQARIERGPLPTIPGNRLRLARLLQNLISNALKYREPSRPLVVEIGAERVDASWVLSVKDNGIGFEPAQAERIMRPFQRLHSKERYPGSGVGLASAKKIVDLHRGRLWAKARPGLGSEFFVMLPAEPA